MDKTADKTKQSSIIGGQAAKLRDNHCYCTFSYYYYYYAAMEVYGSP